MDIEFVEDVVTGDCYLVFIKCRHRVFIPRVRLMMFNNAKELRYFYAGVKCDKCEIEFSDMQKHLRDMHVKYGDNIK